MSLVEFTADNPGGRVDGIVAPVKGLNTQSALAGLDADFAITLDNFVCQPDSLVTRTGAIDFATGFASKTKSLMQYAAGATRKLFAATDTGIFDASVAGAVGAAGIAASSGQGKSVNFATSAGQYLYFVNGVDSAKLYDGAAWSAITGVSTLAITGVTTSTLFDVETYRQRLYFLQNNTLGFWYMPADSVAGAAAFFGIGSLCRQGGRVVGHGTWSIDGGSGPDDHYVVATSEGELVIWRGNNPAVAANWVYVGTFYIGKPFNQNCLVKFGGDLLFLCENGLIPLSGILQSTTRNYIAALTLRIQPTITNAAALYGTLPGWKVHVLPRLSLILINVPTSGTASIQYVYNTYSKGWSTFSGWNAGDFIEYNSGTYFSVGTRVAKAFTGTADFGTNITAICDTSYNRFKTRTQLQPLMIRALYSSTALVSYTIGIAQDFSGQYSESTYGSGSGTSGFWNSGLWNVALWGGGFVLHRDWVTIASRGGLALSTRFKVSSKIATTLLLAVDYKFSDQGLFS